MTRMDLTRFWRALSRLRADRRGIGAVEFALIAPLLLCFYFVSMELSLGLEASKKVSRIGSMVADLVTQQPGKIAKADLEAIMQLGQAVIQPYNRSIPTIVVTGIQITNDATPKVQVAWSRQIVKGVYSMPFAVNSTTSVPDQLKIKGTFLVRVTSTLDYKPLITWSPSQKKTLGLTSAFDSISMGGTYYLRPRMSADISCDGC
ncbi:TadE/TadG family type IV pilus assembly protein [Pseudaminobacter soli (ex Li et al. 2025)]|uniref:Pilus assembly protein n=1 Tax=Pseudaminobacter soli (ex Li et al. 2025) TaxID=1295366 RepID=A0A2P7S5Z5_9HYPH|nr:TadE/TadG family type IV pilus assembly protein [Mesorhizobium soli]PSJ57898.1 pilus assembly protein [Mesorhizobium soli]